MKNILVLLALVFLLTGCPSYPSPEQAEITDSVGAIHIRATGTGYGLYNQYFSSYTSGNLKSIINNTGYFSMSTCTLDASNLDYNEMIITLSFPKRYISTISTNWKVKSFQPTEPEKEEFSFVIKNNKEKTVLLSTYASNGTYSVNAEINEIQIRVKLYKFIKEKRTNNFFTINSLMLR